MKCGTQAALAVGAGYLLGRRRKMRLAAIVAAGAATGGLGGLGGGLLRRGMKMLGSTEALGKVAPQLGDLADAVRGDLIDAGKAAATAAVTNRIESLTDSLHERAELIRQPGEAAAGTATDAAGGATKAARTGAGEATRRVRRARPSARDEEPDELRDEDELGDEEFDSEEPDEPMAEEPEAEEPEAEEPEAEEPEDEEPEDDEPRRPAPRRRRSTTTRRRSPVVRTGR
jgi:hypothetical protein